MVMHANARLGPAGRRELVRLMIERDAERQAAACFGLACTAHRWKRRWLRPASRSERRALGHWTGQAGRVARRAGRRPSSRAGLAARERTGWGPRLIAGEIGVAHSTVHAILKRHGCSRTPRPPREEFVRYEWPCPGDLLHMDVKRYPRFPRPGHAVTGDRTKTGPRSAPRSATTTSTPIVDDHTRLAYGELLDDETRPDRHRLLRARPGLVCRRRHQRPPA